MLDCLLLFASAAFAAHKKTVDVPPALPTFYERVASKLAADPALAAAQHGQTPQMLKVQWLVGTWRVESHVFATATTPERKSAGTSTVRAMMDGAWLQITGDYADGTHGLDYLAFDATAQRWVSVSLGYAGTALVDYASDWVDNRIEFEAHHARLMGVDVELRQTIEKRSDKDYHVLNEEKLGKKWVKLDEYTFAKTER
jgi:hypothetical protein